MCILRYLSIAVLTLVSGMSAADPSYLSAQGETLRPLDVFEDCDVCPEMVVLPLGSFHMGSTVKEANDARTRFFVNKNIDPTKYHEQLREAFRKLRIDLADPEQGLRAFYAKTFVSRYKDPQYSVNPFLHEVPRHEVQIDMPIAMGRNEVTREEWLACVSDGACDQGLKDKERAAWIKCLNAPDCTLTPDDRIRSRLPNGPHSTDPRAPRTGITFNEMLDYTAWLNDKVGANIYRIPTEAEWEYAARAGASTPYAQGDSLTLEQANFFVVRREEVNGKFVFNYDLGSARELLPVDQLDAANAWGLRHLSGNALELTSSCGLGPHRGLSSSSAYLAADANLPDCKRAAKGGSYYVSVEQARPASRSNRWPESWTPSLGFRVVRDLAGMPTALK